MDENSGFIKYSLNNIVEEFRYKPRWKSIVEFFFKTKAHPPKIYQLPFRKIWSTLIKNNAMITEIHACKN